MFGIGNSLRALTRSPVASALELARRQARRFEEGGAVAAQKGEGYLVPLDVDPAVLVAAINAKLQARRRSGVTRTEAVQPILEQLKDNRVEVPAECVTRLGDGNAERGKRELNSIVNQVRAERVLRRAREPQRRRQPGSLS